MYCIQFGVQPRLHRRRQPRPKGVERLEIDGPHDHMDHKTHAAPTPVALWAMWAMAKGLPT